MQNLVLASGVNPLPEFSLTAHASRRRLFRCLRRWAGIVTRPRGCGGGAIDEIGDGGKGAIAMFSDGGYVR